MTPRLALLLFLLVLPACELDLSGLVRFSTEIESLDEDVAAVLAKGGIEDAWVHCPNKEFADNKTVKCEVSARDGHAFTAIAEYSRDEGLFVFVENGAIHTDALEDALLEIIRAKTKSAGDVPTIDCGRRFVLDRRGEQVQCTLEHEGKTTRRVVLLTGGGGFVMKKAG